MLSRLLKDLFSFRKDSPAGPIDVPQSSNGDGSYRNSPEQWLAHGRALEQAGNMSAALECFHACVAAHPRILDARLALAHALSNVWRVEESLAHFTEALKLPPQYPELFSNYLLWKHLAPKPEPRALFDLHRSYGAMMSATVQPRYRGQYRGTRDPQRPLRIGYVSRNFLRHSVGFFIEPVIARHDRSQYRIYCYYTHQVVDETTERIAKLAHVWRHVHADDDEALAARINDDRIDILVDLGGHTKLNRLGVFARQPAPVQMTWMGYPDTTGLAAIDYRITDAIADPAPGADELHTERLLRVDAPFLCYQPPRDSPPVASRDVGAVVFGSFNMLAKLNAPTIDIWARILNGVPGSRMLLKSSLFKHDETVNRVLECFRARGVARERIEARNWTAERAEHLGAYGEIDIALDTFPYNGTTTTCEALWMGVPVITLAGEVHMSRVGTTLLTSVGLRDLVATDADDYVRIAVALGCDSARRETLRSEMRARLASSPLLDHEGFTRKLESRMRQSWQRWCEAQASG